MQSSSTSLLAKATRDYTESLLQLTLQEGFLLGFPAARQEPCSKNHRPPHWCSPSRSHLLQTVAPLPPARLHSTKANVTRCRQMLRKLQRYIILRIDHTKASARQRRQWQEQLLLWLRAGRKFTRPRHLPGSRSS